MPCKVQAPCVQQMTEDAVPRRTQMYAASHCVVHRTARYCGWTPASSDGCAWRQAISKPIGKGKNGCADTATPLRHFSPTYVDAAIHANIAHCSKPGYVSARMPQRGSFNGAHEPAMQRERNTHARRSWPACSHHTPPGRRANASHRTLGMGCSIILLDMLCGIKAAAIQSHKSRCRFGPLPDGSAQSRCCRPYFIRPARPVAARLLDALPGATEETHIRV